MSPRLEYLLEKREWLYLELDKETQSPWSIRNQIQIITEQIQDLLNASYKGGPNVDYDRAGETDNQKY